MTVKEILSHKGSDVVTTDPNASVSEAIKLLGARRIGAVVVTGADRRMVGILSERDIVRALAEKGAKALDMPIAEIMTRKVITCGIGETVSELMERMTTGKFRHVPVIDQGRLAGIISIGDVVKSRVQEMEQESAALQDYIRTAVDQVRQPFYLNAAAQAAAVEALKHQDEVERRVTKTLAARLDLEEGVRELGVWVAESDANFIWLHLPDGAEEPAVASGLRERGALVRAGASLGREGALRVTVGTGAENDRFVGALGELLRS